MRILLSMLALIAFQANATIDVVDFTPTLVCEGSQTTFTSTSTVSGGVTITDWNWDLDADGQFDDAFGPTINHQFNSPGVYNVGLQIMTDGAEVAAAYQLITVNPVPVADFSSPDVCEGTATTLTDLSSIASGSIVSWEWDLDNDGLYDNAVGSSIVNDFLVAGSYTVGLQVTSDQGCQSTTSENVTVDPMPTVAFSISSICLGDETELTGISTVSSGLVTDYDWELNGNGFFDDASGMVINEQFITDGNYQIGLQVTSDQGCVNDTFQLVVIAPHPYVNFSFDNNLCQDQAVQFTNLTGNIVGTITYEWIFEIGQTSTDEHPSYSFFGAGPNDVQLIGLTSYGCADTLIQTVTVNPTPEAGFTAEGVCWGDITEFVNTTDPKGSTIQSYSWDFGDGSNVGSGPDPDHEYFDADSFFVTLVAYTTDNCTDTFQNYIQIWQLPDPEITADGVIAFCYGEEVTLSVAPIGVTTLWSTADNTPSITVDTTDTYRVLIVDAHSCEGVDSISVLSWLLPELTISNDTTISLGENVPLWVAGADFHDWVATTYLDDAAIATPTSIAPKENITYTVTGTDMNGCQSSISVSIEIIIDYLLKPVSLFTPNGDNVNETFYIENIDCYGDCDVKVYNRWGLEVFSAMPYVNLNNPLGDQSLSTAFDGTFNDEDLPDGTYYYVIECGGRSERFDGAISILRNNN